MDMGMDMDMHMHTHTHTHMHMRMRITSRSIPATPSPELRALTGSDVCLPQPLTPPPRAACWI